MKILSDILNLLLQNVQGQMQPGLGYAVSVCGVAANIMCTAEQKVVIKKIKILHLSLLWECVAETRSQLSELLSQIHFDCLVTISYPVQVNSRYEVVLAD